MNKEKKRRRKKRKKLDCFIAGNKLVFKLKVNLETSDKSPLKFEPKKNPNQYLAFVGNQTRLNGRTEFGSYSVLTENRPLANQNACFGQN